MACSTLSVLVKITNSWKDLEMLEKVAWTDSSEDLNFSFIIVSRAFMVVSTSVSLFPVASRPERRKEIASRTVMHSSPSRASEHFPTMDSKVPMHSSISLTDRLCFHWRERNEVTRFLTVQTRESLFRDVD